MPDYIQRTRRRPSTLRKVEALIIDDNMIVDFIRDMRFYEYVPSLEPIRREIIRLSARLAKAKGTSRSGHWDLLRKWLEPLVRRFHTLLTADGFDQLRVYLKDRKRIEAKTLVFSESPY